MFSTTPHNPNASLRTPTGHILSGLESLLVRMMSLRGSLDWRTSAHKNNVVLGRDILHGAVLIKLTRDEKMIRYEHSRGGK